VHLSSTTQADYPTLGDRSRRYLLIDIDLDPRMGKCLLRIHSKYDAQRERDSP
jgi:hypothetical protein